MLAAAECDWSEEFPIPNEYRLNFRECVAEKKIKIGDIELQANIDFHIVHANYPEGNTIWSVHSPDGKTAVVYVENNHYQRNAWVIDMESKEIKLFSDHAEGRHFDVRFDSNDQFRVVHAGMGYRTDCMFERNHDNWVATGCVKLDVGWPNPKDPH